MENSKKSILERLYLVRALLSKISENKDKMAEVEKLRAKCKESEFVSSIKRSNNNNNSNLKNYAADLYKEKIELERLEKECKELDDREKKINQEIRSVEASMSVPYDATFNIIMSVISFAVTFGVVFLLFKWWINTHYSFWVGLLLFPVLLISIVWDVIVISTCNKKTHDNGLVIKQRKLDNFLKERETIKLQKFDNIKIQDDIREKLKEIQAKIADEKQKTKLSEEKQKQIEEDLIAKEYTEFYETKKQKLKEYDQSQITILNESEVIFDQLKKLDIDERDWAMLDLVIYELETGRADNVKEALQQADLYIRHNEMKQAMQSATMMICSSIKEQAVTLQKSIENSLAQLRSDVSGLHSGISELNIGISELNQSNNELSAKFDEIIDAQKLNNSLLNKANVSSERLADDVRRMKEVQRAEHFGNKYYY